jgi:hypothetical protein
VSLSALARRFDGDLPPGSVDAASAVMIHPDAIVWAPTVDGTAPAITGAGPDALHTELFDQSPARGGRRLVPLLERAPGLRDLLMLVVETFLGNGSVVLVDNRDGSWDEDRLRRLAESERAS